jgi:hypothetical protein
MVRLDVRGGAGIRVLYNIVQLASQSPENGRKNSHPIFASIYQWNVTVILEPFAVCSNEYDQLAVESKSDRNRKATHLNQAIQPGNRVDLATALRSNLVGHWLWERGMKCLESRSRGCRSYLTY